MLYSIEHTMEVTSDEINKVIVQYLFQAGV